MKTKSIGGRPMISALAIAALAALLQAAPPVDDSKLPAIDRAKHKVAVEIYKKVNRVNPPFSRAGPRPSHKLEFQPELLVKEEPRLPFAVIPFRTGKESVIVRGYVRLSDQAIFLINPKTGEARPASEDPCFAPPPVPAPKIEPVKPV